MLPQVILVVSLLLQVVAAVLSIRLLRVTGRLPAWILLSLVMVLQGVRRAMALLAALSGHAHADLLDEGLGLLISTGMLVVVCLIKEHFAATARSDERLRSLFQGLPQVAVQGYGPDGTVQYWNQASERLYGYTAQEAIGRNLLDLIIPPEMREGVSQAVQQMSTTGQPIPASELSLMRKDGSRVAVFSSHALVQMPGCKPELFCVDIDLTERKRAEGALLASESQLQVILESTGDGLLAVDRQGKVIRTNRRLAELWRIPSAISASGDYQALVEHALPQLSDPEAFQEQVRSLYASDATALDEILFKDGRCFERFSSPLREGSVITGRAWSFRDITEQKNLENSLRENERRLNQLIGNLPGFVYRGVLVERWTLAYMSEGCREITGHGPEAFIGDQNLSYNELLLPSHREAIRLKWQQALRDHAIFEEEYPITTASREIRWVWERGHGTYDGAGHLLFVEGFVTDITARRRAETALRESEARFRTLVEWLPEAVGVHQDGKMVYANAAAIQMYGAISANDLVGRPIFDFIHPDYHQIALERLKSPPTEQVGRQMIAARHTRLDGTAIEVESKSTSIVYNGAQSTLVVTRDITERKRAEAEKDALEVLNRQLQKAESLGRMAGAIAHHFNNKLQSLMVNLELMAELPKGTDPAQFLARAKQATEQAAEVSRLLLVYLGQTPSEQNPQFLSQLCHATLPMLQVTLPPAVTLEMDCPSPGPVIRANANEMHQVLANLVTNAWEAMGDARGSIRLSLRTCAAADIPTAHRFPIGWRPQGPEFACLEVTDSGYGIESADIEKLFDPFFSTQLTGRGLGLPVVLGIVRAHGGAVAVESRQSQGSIFRIYLPVWTEAIPRAPETGVQAPRPEGGGTILLVDDDALLLESTGALVEKLGFTLLTAKDGVEAVEVFRQHQGEIWCVITDLTMPRMDGWETLTALRQLDPALPVILASGYDKAQVLSGTHPVRPQAFLSKPYDRHQFSDALGQALAARGASLSPPDFPPLK